MVMRSPSLFSLRGWDLSVLVSLSERDSGKGLHMRLWSISLCETFVHLWQKCSYFQKKPLKSLMILTRMRYIIRNNLLRLASFIPFIVAPITTDFLEELDPVDTVTVLRLLVVVGASSSSSSPPLRRLLRLLVSFSSSSSGK